MIFPKYKIIGLMIAAAMLFLIGCQQQSEEEQAAEELKKDSVLTVLIRNAPTIYYEGPEGHTGFEYDLVKALADSMDKELELKVYYSVEEIIYAIEQGKGDIASAAITKTKERQKEYNFTHGYHNVQQQVVYNRGSDYPKSIEELQDFEIVVANGSSYEERLIELKEEYPDLDWESSLEMSSEQILREVWRGNIECTIVDDNILSVNRRYFPGLQVAFPITEQQELAWIVQDGNDDFLGYVNSWIEDFEDEYQLALLRDKYYSHVTKYDYVDLRAFHKRINSRLPKYKGLFKRAADKHGIPWTLLAAQAYQESHWYKYAKSPTGVRGIMMLTRRTARSLGVTNRVDPTQSIMGGAKYLKRLERIVPDNFREEDRTNYLLAAYNVGMGHMKDARTLAERLNYNPNIWRDIKEVLPLLSNPKYYRNLKYGYARGTEPVRYVDRILNYRSILEQKDIELSSR